jgi:Tfp pilus assembly protein PilF
LKASLFNLNGVLSALEGEDERAEKELRSAVESDPAHAPFAGDLAVFLAERGRLQEGAEVLDEALKHVEYKDDLQQMRDRMTQEIAGA